jgi:uncharacterized radical SAM protein YgiQ
LNHLHITDWLPASKKEVEARGWDQPDVILFTGDAYVDHPSFGAAVIGRVLEADGVRVAIVPQPNWRDDLRDFKKLGVPRLFFGISGGCMDSMVNHYTANKRLRSDDAYTAGNVAGFRPDDTVTVYSRILKDLYPAVPVIIGGIEASLRRLTHYDYWRDTLKPSILVDSRADLLVYGMGEHIIREVAHHLQEGRHISELTELPQTAYLTVKPITNNKPHILLHAYENCAADKRKFAENFCRIETESNKMNAARLVEPVGGKYAVVNPPEHRVDEKDVDLAFDLPYTRLPHPRYKDKPVPAFEMIKFSVNIHRGCFGGCSFCTISAHQGKFVASRSERSILNEVRQVTQMPGFKGCLSDLGGPSANMFRMKGRDAGICSKCSRYSCIHPKICKNLDVSHSPLLALYRKIRSMNDIRKVFIGSGVRYDLLLDANGFLSREHAAYFDELLQHHVSGRLKVAPEHTVPHVLKAMRKPGFDLFLKTKEEFDRIDRSKSLRQQLIPYFISSHPGCTEADMRQLAGAMQQMHFNRLEQVQDFTPTPMTLSSVMFYCGFDPYTGEKLYVARRKKEKLKQKEYFFKQESIYSSANGRISNDRIGHPGQIRN